MAKGNIYIYIYIYILKTLLLVFLWYVCMSVCLFVLIVYASMVWLQVKIGPLSVSPMGFGTWAWGNQLLWGYQESMDTELQQTFNLAVENGINLFDTADSYGTGRLNGQSERLLGKFIREFQGHFSISRSIFFIFSHQVIKQHWTLN
jgi:hypothetical protein